MLSDDYTLSFPAPPPTTTGPWEAIGSSGTNETIFAFVLALVTVIVLLAVVIVTTSAGRRGELGRRVVADRALEGQLAELKGRLAAMSELGAARQSELTSMLEVRLGHVTREVAKSLAETRSDLAENLAETSRRLGESVLRSSERTGDHLARLGERLAVIDSAQAKLTELSNRVVSLQDVLADNQARGAFGQVRMEAIIEDGLPSSAYTFQATLSNGKRPDCLIHLPNAPAGIVVDAKFPLEGFEALRAARSDEEEKQARSQVRAHVGRHIEDIAGKYLIPGETQDTALMFVPSESAYGELHENFADLIQKAHRARIFIVSPNMLMLAIQTMQAILKDVRMREAAGLIQREVSLMMSDVGRLIERVGDLDRHFGLAGKTLEKVLTSSDKIRGRGRKIETLELGEETIGEAETGSRLQSAG